MLGCVEEFAFVVPPLGPSLSSAALDAATAWVVSALSVGRRVLVTPSAPSSEGLVPFMPTGSASAVASTSMSTSMSTSAVSAASLQAARVRRANDAASGLAVAVVMAQKRVSLFDALLEARAAHAAVKLPAELAQQILAWGALRPVVV